MSYGVWGQSGPNVAKITELVAVEGGQGDDFGGGCTRWQFGDGGISIPHWSVPGGEDWEGKRYV